MVVHLAFGSFTAAASAALILAFATTAAGAAETKSAPRVLVVDFAAELGQARPVVGFLGGLRDSIPDSLIKPLHPTLWRIGHQFRGRIAGGLPAAVDRVEKLGARYKLVMSDLITSNSKDWEKMDWAKYDADIQRLVKEVGDRAGRIIWEPVNEPDISHKPIERYYELHARAFRALRKADARLEICGPGFAFPSYDKTRQFLDYCRDNDLECNYVAWHYTGWDPQAPENQKWRLGELPDLCKQYPKQKVREIHCDEWGAGPDKPGRLHPGRAVVWLHYLENVYKVDRACRANWGKEDDYLGGIVTADAQPHPAWHVYRLYAAAVGATRVRCTGSDRQLACLAARARDQCQVLLGCTGTAPIGVELELRAVGIKDPSVDIRVIGTADLGGVLPADADLPQAVNYRARRDGDVLRITFDNVHENEAYYVTVTPAKR
jgi:xylan 1,4-beta-xylosidase